MLDAETDTSSPTATGKLFSAIKEMRKNRMLFLLIPTAFNVSDPIPEADSIRAVSIIMLLIDIEYPAKTFFKYLRVYG